MNCGEVWGGGYGFGTAGCYALWMYYGSAGGSLLKSFLTSAKKPYNTHNTSFYGFFLRRWRWGRHHLLIVVGLHLHILVHMP